MREADFLNIVAWRGTADFCNRYLHKGRRIAIEGSIQTRSYDAQDGTKRYVTEIVAESVEAVSSKESNGASTRGAETPPPPPENNAPDSFAGAEDDELPF